MSKLIFFEYECVSHGTFEKLGREAEQHTPCPVCSKPSLRRISAPRISLEGWSLSFPTAADKWARNHIEAAKIARERDES
jgi:hypothetical protein